MLTIRTPAIAIEPPAKVETVGTSDAINKANPVAKGGPELMAADIAEYYAGTFDDAALKALWWWPEQTAEFVAKRGEYADKYKAA